MTSYVTIYEKFAIKISDYTLDKMYLASETDQVNIQHIDHNSTISHSPIIPLADRYQPNVITNVAITHLRVTRNLIISFMMLYY